MDSRYDSILFLSCTFTVHGQNIHNYRPVRRGNKMNIGKTSIIQADRFTVFSIPSRDSVSKIFTISLVFWNTLSKIHFLIYTDIHQYFYGDFSNVYAILLLFIFKYYLSYLNVYGNFFYYISKCCFYRELLETDATTDLPVESNLTL